MQSRTKFLVRPLRRSPNGSIVSPHAACPEALVNLCTRPRCDHAAASERPEGTGVALTWVRTHEWDIAAWRRPLGVPRQRSRRVLPDREHGPRTRADRDGPADLHRLHRPRGVPRVRARHEPGSRASGAAPPKRSAGSCARRGSPSSASTPAEPPAPAQSSLRAADRSALRSGMREVDPRPVVAVELDRATELGRHERLHDREPEAATTARS